MAFCYAVEVSFADFTLFPFGEVIKRCCIGTVTSFWELIEGCLEGDEVFGCLFIRRREGEFERLDDLICEDVTII